MVEELKSNTYKSNQQTQQQKRIVPKVFVVNTELTQLQKRPTHMTQSFNVEFDEPPYVYLFTIEYVETRTTNEQIPTTVEEAKQILSWEFGRLQLRKNTNVWKTELCSVASQNYRRVGKLLEADCY